MNNYDKILELVKQNNGYVTTNHIVKNNINKMFLTQMVKNGTLIRISRGYYGLPVYIEDVYYTISLKSKNVRFSLETALYLHGLTNRTPLVYSISLPVGYSGVLQKDNNLRITYVNKDILDLGAQEIISPFGTKIKVYDAERTICDIIKHKNKVDAEIFSEALKNYVKSKKKNLNKLYKYAKALKIEKKLRQYLEVLL